jgi:hypothetical protein
MTNKEATDLVNRSIRVILSCETLHQLNVAVEYSNLVYRLIAEGVGLINNTRFISLTERSIGFAQCQIKHEILPLKAVS